MEHVTKQGVPVIYLTGNLLSDESNKPVTVLMKEYLESGKHNMLFNLKDVKYMNSTGLSVLLSASAAIGRAGGAMALCEVPQQVKQLIHMIKLENVLLTLPDEEAGIAFLSKAA